ncbi:unnamed protein product [Prorocentrum cordatum]|uniref:Reverse transcriptase domain-containing protein n=1 Tax=Prorocentrum cordatum TaxID=2364126 RepID=A0ABN9QR97_9DINO|nr:unnamed protein product [Polarella glacialis]
MWERLTNHAVTGVVSYLARCPQVPSCPACPVCSLACGSPAPCLGCSLQCPAIPPCAEVAPAVCPSPPPCPTPACPTCGACPAPEAAPAPAGPEVAAPSAAAVLVSDVAIDLRSLAAGLVGGAVGFLLAAACVGFCCVVLRKADRVNYTADSDPHTVVLANNAEVQAARFGAFDPSPPGIAGVQVHRSRAEPTDSELAQCTLEAEQIATAECCTRAAAIGDLGLPTNLRSLVGPGDPAGVRGAAACEGGYRIGDVVLGREAPAARVLDRDMHVLPDGQGLLVELGPPAAPETFLREAVDADTRILPIVRDGRGRGGVPGHKTEEMTSQEDFGSDGTLPCPRTAAGCMSYLQWEGLCSSIEGHHEHLAQVGRLATTDWGVQVHCELCQHIRAATSQDLLEGANLISIEMKVGRPQTFEFAHWDKAVGAESKGVGGKMGLKGQAAVSGFSRSTSSVMVSPGVIEQVHGGFEKEAMLHKSLRLGREERESMRENDVRVIGRRRPRDILPLPYPSFKEPLDKASIKELARAVAPRELRPRAPEPLGARLATGDAFGMLEMAADDSLLTVEGADLKDAFYHFELPEQLRPCFSLRPVRAGVLGIKEVGGVAVGASTKLYPRLGVVPMGWSWAMWWCQSVMERVAEAAGRGDDARLRDGRPAPLLDPSCHLEYVDNFVGIGYDAEAVRSAVARVMTELKRRGLVVTRGEHLGDSEGEYAVLGWSITAAGRLSASASRLWRVRLAVRGLLRRGRASGRDLERVLGHIMFVALVRREGLSIFEASFRFVQKCYDQQVPLWSQVRQELMAWDGVAPLLWRDLRAQWSCSVGCVDASPRGLGACEADWDVGAVREVGRHSERWRYGRAERLPPRRRALAAECAADGVAACDLGIVAAQLDPGCPAEDSQPVGPPVERDLLAFPEVSKKYLDKSLWRVTGPVILKEGLCKTPKYKVGLGPEEYDPPRGPIKVGYFVT